MSDSLPLSSSTAVDAMEDVDLMPTSSTSPSSPMDTDVSSTNPATRPQPPSPTSPPPPSSSSPAPSHSSSPPPFLPPTSPPSLPHLLPLSDATRQRLIAVKLRLRAAQLRPLQQKIAQQVLALTPFPTEPAPPPPPPPPPPLPPLPSVALAEPRRFLLRRPLSSLALSIPSLAPHIPGRSPQVTAAQLIARMPVQALPSTVAAAQAVQAVVPFTPIQGVAKARKDAETLEAVRRQVARQAEMEEQRKAKELQKQRRLLRRHFLASLKAHREAFLAFHRGRAKAQHHLAKAAGKNQEVVEKRRKALEEKSKKDRMKALKENDMAEYLKLLEGHKNDRLTSLLQQTDQYLTRLGKMIRGGGVEEVKQPKAYLGKGNRSWRRDKEERDAWEQEERTAGRDPNVSWAQRQAQIREEADKREQQTKAETGETPAGKEEAAEEREKENGPPPPTTVDEGILSLSQFGERISEQPKLLSGGTLKGYQLKGLEWMVSLYNCLTLDSQVLTDDGFLFHHQVQARLQGGRTLRVACYNPSSLSLEYHPISLRDVVHQTKSQHLIHFHSSDPTASIDIRVTANHDMYTREGSLDPALATSAPFTKVQAGSLLADWSDEGRHVHFLTSAMGGVDHGERDWTSQPFAVALGLTNDEQVAAFLELYGYWMSSGDLEDTTSSILFACDGEAAELYLDGLFVRLPMSASSEVDRRPGRVALRSRRWWEYFAEQCACTEREASPLPRSRHSPPSRTRSICTGNDDELLEGDVCDVDAYVEQETSSIDDPATRLWPWVLSDMGKTELRHIVRGLRFASSADGVADDDDAGFVYTTSAQLRDRLQLVLLHAGFSCTFSLHRRESDVIRVHNQSAEVKASRDRWQLSFSLHPQATQPLVHTTEDVTEERTTTATPVWCVSVPQKDQLIVARRVLETAKDGSVTAASRPVITGNSKMNGILADEMGLGKTVQTIALFCYLMEKKNNQGPFLCVVPLSTLHNWFNEFARFAPSIKCIVYHGNRPTRHGIWTTQVQRGEFHVLLTTYDFIINRKDTPKLGSIPWEYVVVDEGHRMKNAESKLTTTLATKYTSQHRLILTGTPLQNSLKELWALLNFLLPTVFNSVDNFEDWFNKPFEQAGIERTELDEEEKLLIINRLHQVLRPFLLRRLKSEVADQLPEKVECVLKCELSAMQLVMYNQIKNKAFSTVDKRTGDLRPAKLSNILMQLRKVCNSPLLFSQQLGLDWHTTNVGLDIVRCSGKFALLHRMLPKLLRAGHRVLIFCQMTRVMDIIEEYFEWAKFQWLRLDGTHAVGDRIAALNAFNAEDSVFNIFLLSTRAGGLGLNLQSADTVIIFDSDWNPQMDIQAQDRAHRVGQKKEVRVFRLITMSPVEEGILERARFKLGIDQMVIQSGKFNAQSSADERKDLLQAVLREGVKYGSEVRAPSDVDINQMMARTEDEVGLFTRIDAEIDERDRQAWAADGKGPNGPPSRLITEAEVPGYIQNPDAVMEQQRGPEQELGRGVRQTKAAVSYAEELTDKEFERALERGEDPYEAVLRKQERRILIEQGILPDTARKRKKKRPMNGEKKPRLNKEEVKDDERLEDAEGLLDDTESSGSSSSSASGDEEDGDEKKKKKVKDEEDDGEEVKDAEDADSSRVSRANGPTRGRAPVRRRLLGSGRKRGRPRGSAAAKRRGQRQSPVEDDEKDASADSGKEEKDEVEDDDEVKEVVMKDEDTSASTGPRRGRRGRPSSAASASSSLPPLVPSSRSEPPPLLPRLPLLSSPTMLPPPSSSSYSRPARPSPSPPPSKSRPTPSTPAPSGRSNPRATAEVRVARMGKNVRRQTEQKAVEEAVEDEMVVVSDEDDLLPLSAVLKEAVSPHKMEETKQEPPPQELPQSPLNSTPTRRKPRRAR